MLRTLNSFAVDLIGIPTQEDLFWYVAQNVVGKLGFLDCVIYQADLVTSELKQVAAWGDKNPFDRDILNPLVIPFGRGITGSVAKTGKPIVVNDLLKNRDYIPDMEPARSEICVPFFVSGEIAGVIDSEDPSIAAFGNTEIEILTTVAAMTSAKLELLAEASRSAERYEALVKAHGQLTRETLNRKALQSKLFEARKIEAVGRLTGRFAHEFNSILTVIAGNIEFIELEVPSLSSSPLLHDAKAAAARGTRLIKDMLSFGQRMRMNPEPVALDGLLSEFCADLARTHDIEVAYRPGPALRTISVDRAALETILFNICMNGAEAMGETGRLTISGRNLFHPGTETGLNGVDLISGPYVEISISDEGPGIEAGSLPQIFDPFFTTKAPGQGPGLGLSVVQGLMKQTGGAVAVRSAEGAGTTVHLYFPALTPTGADPQKAAF